MCTEIRFANKQDGEITSVGGVDRFFGSETPWGLSRDAVVGLIDTGRWSFFVDRPTATPPDRVRVEVAQRGSTRYLKTAADGDVPNNLLALPEQNPELTDRPPGGLSSGLPGARRPSLIGIYTPARPTPLSAPNARGAFPVLPSPKVNIRFRAPFSNDYEVRVDGDFPLYRAPSDTVSLPDPLEQRGWWALTRVGYFGSFQPGMPMQIERDDTLFEMTVRLPESVVRSALVSILLVQLSLNQNCRPPENKSEGLSLALEVPDPSGGLGTVSSTGSGSGTGSMPGSTSTLPRSGVETVSLFTDPAGQDDFDLLASGLDPGNRFAGARITTVKNASTDINGDATVHFFRLSHVDTDGATISRVGTVARPYLLAGEATGDFRGLLFNGPWRLRVSNISAQLYDRRRVRLEVAWNRP